jgi:hypothetical protein
VRSPLTILEMDDELRDKILPLAGRADPDPDPDPSPTLRVIQAIREEQRDADWKRVKPLIEALDRWCALMPECFTCMDCGPLITVDEDGCCTMCGLDAGTMQTREVLADLGVKVD